METINRDPVTEGAILLGRRYAKAPLAFPDLEISVF